jgi:photosystem II stability/assembly factor-like uncharacterized protein
MAELHHRRAVQAIVGGEQVAVIELEKAKRFAPEDELYTDLIDELIALSDGEKELPEVLHSWGEKAIELGLWDEAADLFNAFKNAGGDPEEVQDHIDRIEEEIRKRRISSYQQQAERMTRLRHYDEAIDALETILSLNPPDPDQIRESIEELWDELRTETAAPAPPKSLWRRWWLWAGLILVAILAVWLGQPSSPLRVSQVEPTRTKYPTWTPINTAPYKPTSTGTPTITPTPTSTPIPLEWRRLNSASSLKRDMVVSIAIDPTDPDVICAGMARSGVYKTINGGISWFPVHNGLNRGWIHNLVIDPENPDRVYVGTFSGGLFETENGGDLWERVEVKETHFIFDTYVAINPSNSRHVISTGWDGIAASLDGGETWQHFELKDRGVITLTFDPRNQNLIGTADDPGIGTAFIYLSEDGGETWEVVFSQEGYSYFGSLYINPYREEMFYSNEWGRDEHFTNTFRSLDGGRSWDLWSTEFQPFFVTSEGKLFGAYWDGIAWTSDGGNNWNYEWLGEGIDLRTGSQSSSDPSTMVIAGESLYFTNDGGETWEERTSGLGTRNMEIGYSISADEFYIREKLCEVLGSDCSWISGRFFRFEPSNGVVELVSEFGCEDPDMAGMPFVEIFCSNIDREDETRVVDATFVSPVDPDHMYGQGRDGPWIAHSIDGGITWERCAPGYEYLEPRITDSISAVALHPYDPEIAYFATYSGLIITHDGCNTLIVQKGIDTIHVNSVVLNPQNPEIVYVGTDSGVYVSYDGGHNWGKVNDGLLGALVIYSLTINPNNPDDVYATTPYGIFKLENK